MAALFIALLIVLVTAPQDIAGAAVNDDCTSAACTDTNTVCDAVSNKCQYKSGATCTASTAYCITGATCSSTSSPCVCGTSLAAKSTGVCGYVVGQTCTAESDCVDNAQCTLPSSGGTDKKCSCKTGYTAQTAGTCSGTGGLIVSSFLLISALLFTTNLK